MTNKEASARMAGAGEGALNLDGAHGARAQQHGRAGQGHDIGAQPAVDQGGDHGGQHRQGDDLGKSHRLRAGGLGGASGADRGGRRLQSGPCLLLGWRHERP